MNIDPRSLGINSDFRICGTRSNPVVVNHKTGTIFNTTSDDVIKLKAFKTADKHFVTRCRRMGILMPDGVETVDESYGPHDPHLDDVHIDVTNRCNMSCPHCYQNVDQSGRNDLPIAAVIHLIPQIRALGGARVALSGGEPFLYPWFEKAVGAVHDNQLALIAVFTNGVKMDYGLLDLTPKYTTILISNNKALGHPDTTQVAVKVAKDRRVIVTTVTLDGSDLDGIYESLRGSSIFRWRVGVARPVGRGANLHPDMDKVIGNYKAIFHKWLAEYDKGKAPFDLQIGFAFQGGYLTQKRIDLYSDNCACCWYKRKSMAVKWDGRVTPCSMDNTTVGHIDDLAAAWGNMQTLSHRRLRAREIEGCKDCRLLHLCNGGCRACVEKGKETVSKDIISCRTYEFLDEILPLLRERGVKDDIRNEDYQKGHLPNLPASS